MKSCRSIDELAAAFGLGETQAAALSSYVDLLLGWTKANVTGLRTREEVVGILLGDALALLDVPQLLGRAGARWLDLGAGAGVPGLPLAVAVSESHLVLLDAVARKCAFLKAAVGAAGLTAQGRRRLRAQRGPRRRGGAGREPATAVVLARAVAPLPALVELAAPLLARGGVLLASKTAAAVREEAAGGEAVAKRCGLAAGPVVPLSRSPLDDAVCAVYEKVGDDARRRASPAGPRDAPAARLTPAPFC